MKLNILVWVGLLRVFSLHKVYLQCILCFLLHLGLHVLLPFSKLEQIAQSLNWINRSILCNSITPSYCTNSSYCTIQEVIIFFLLFLWYKSTNAVSEKRRVIFSFTTVVLILFFNFMSNFIIYFYLVLDLIREEKQSSKYIWISTSNVAKFLFIFYLNIV